MEDPVAEIEKGLARRLNLEDDILEIVIEETEKEEIDDNLYRSLIGTILTDKTFRIDYFKTTMVNAWKLKNKVTIKEMGKNLFFFIFETIEDKTSVINRGPWNYENQILLLKTPDKNQKPKEVVFTEAAFWIQVHNLPLGAMKKSVATTIGKALGNLIQIDEKNNEICWGTFVRIRVSIDIHKPLRRGSFISVPGCDRTWVSFKYERLPRVCEWCGILGHGGLSCEFRMDEGKGCFDETIRAKKEEWKVNSYEAYLQENYSSTSKTRSEYRNPPKEKASTANTNSYRESKGTNETGSSIPTVPNKAVVGSNNSKGKDRLMSNVEELQDTATSPTKLPRKTMIKKDIVLQQEKPVLLSGKQAEEDGLNQPLKQVLVREGVSTLAKMELINNKLSKAKKVWKRKEKNNKSDLTKTTKLGKRNTDYMQIDGKEEQSEDMKKLKGDLEVVNDVLTDNKHVTGTVEQPRYEQ